MNCCLFPIQTNKPAKTPGMQQKNAFPIVTGRNEVVAKVIFLHLSVIHSVHRGGMPQCMLGYPPPEQTPPLGADPPGADPPPGADTPLSRPSKSRHPPGSRPPTPPREADCSIRSTSGRYASYWNAFLLRKGLLRNMSVNYLNNLKKSIRV